MATHGYTVQTTRRFLYARRMVRYFRWWWAWVGIRFIRMNVWLQYVQSLAWKYCISWFWDDMACRKYIFCTSSKEIFTDMKWRPWYLATFVLNLIIHHEVSLACSLFVDSSLQIFQRPSLTILTQISTSRWTHWHDQVMRYICRMVIFDSSVEN